MSSGHSLPQFKLGVQGGFQGDSHNGGQGSINPDLRIGFSFRIPTQLACAYLKDHRTGRALDWFDVLGYKVVEEKATDYAQLKHALMEQFPMVRNKSELETRFYAWYQNQNQRPSDFVYELLMIHRNIKLEMAEEELLDHIISRLEPQLLDYTEVRHPQTMSSLLQLIDKYKERFLNRMKQGTES
ncbi:uncharacterized protein TNCV_2177651 [Trichonephila clavipes]|uniref:Retrotransposon gag domain-containing protein n=1 Tax=Trichonephila clavipes TaxID=2585209 RepID=A0A8X7B8T5_TRICX|nr:uncharacterized protein TNCV_2177651 [Trichonephila clavipes]